MKEILKEIKNISNISHYKMVEKFVNACEKDNLDEITKWDIRIINRYWPELTNHKELSSKQVRIIKDKLLFCKESY